MIKHTRFIALLSWVLLCACESRGVDPSSAEPSPPPPTEAQQTEVVKAPLPAPSTPAAAAVPEPAALTTKAELGKPAPDFTLPDLAGKSIKLSDYKGKTVVLEWFNPDCPFVKHARGEGELKTMASKAMGDDLVWLTINSSAPGKQGHGVERNQAAAQEYEFSNSILLDESGAVGKSYGAEKTPHLFVISKAGDLIYRGAIDNAPIGKVDPERPRLPDAKEGALINYVSAALDDVKASKALRLAETAAYGCSVKYGDS